MLMQQTRLLTIPLNLGGYAHFVDSIFELAAKRTSSYVCVANVHTCVESYRNKDFSNAVAQADMVTPDGMPLNLALRWLYQLKQERIAGPDLMPVLLRESEKRKLRVFFYGCTQEVLDTIREKCRVDFPQLEVAGMISPPYRGLTEEETLSYQQTINDSGANLVLVSLGCPKQERWMASMKGKIDAVMIGVGAAFPMMAGVERRAPRWMQRVCLEWLFRMLCNPRRLFKRYFVTNTYFLYLLLLEKTRLTLFSAPTPPKRSIIEYYI